MATTKELFQVIRRSYRVAHKTPIMADGAIENFRAATNALRTFTGKWDTCEPLRQNWPVYSFKRMSSGKWCRFIFVSAACSRWLKKN